jgi:hypothetical protein
VRIEGRKRYGLVAATVAAVLVGGGIAVAFWTTAGTGAGSAGVGTTQNVTITQDGTVSGLFPSDDVADAQPIDFTITNPNAGPVRITTVTLDVLSVTEVPGGNPALPPCTAADFEVVGAALDQDIPPGPTAFVGTTTGASIRMVNTDANQDRCKGASVAISFTTP